MHIAMKTAGALALVLSMAISGASGALAKAHDNGIADGTQGDPSVGGQTAGGGTDAVRNGNAISDGQKGGQRGAAASDAKDGNNGGKGNSDGDGGPAADD